MVRNDAQFTNESFEPVLFGEQIQPVHQIGLKRLKQFEMHRSTSYWIKTHFRTLGRDPDSKWVKIPVYKLLSWIN